MLKCGVHLAILGFQFRFIGPFNTTQGISLPSKTEEKAIEAETIKSDALKDEAEVSEGTQESVPDGVDDNVLIGKFNSRW